MGELFWNVAYLKRIAQCFETTQTIIWAPPKKKIKLILMAMCGSIIKITLLRKEKMYVCTNVCVYIYVYMYESDEVRISSGVIFDLSWVFLNAI